MNARVASRSRMRAFSMIELMIATVIVAILASLAIPILNALKKKAQIARMQVELIKLDLAVKVYETEYSKYPIPTASVGKDYQTKTDSSFMAVLLGKDEKQNPRKLVFFESEPASEGSPGLKPGPGPGDSPSYVDVWGNECFVIIDGDDDSKVIPPEGVPGGAIPEGVIVWSTGVPAPDGTLGGPGSWIRSWE